MDKLRMESPDMTAQNIDRIAALFPNCITEMLDEEHSTPEKKVYKRAVNFELLKQMLSPDVVDGDEAYEFTWVGKKAAIVEANKPIRKTLRPCVAESKDWDTTENLYIEGDNLEVLKLLQESYLGKVKMIYIDPAAGSGTLVLALAHEIGESNCTIYTQDISQKSNEFLRLNLILNNLVHSLPNVVHDDTLLRPYHKNAKGDGLAMFDYIVSNPPFNMDFSDSRDTLAGDNHKKRFFAGVPSIPKKDIEKMAVYLLFIQHILYSLAPKGKAAIVVPTGFLTKSGIAKKIREYLVKEKMLRGVISMPSNIFATTGTNVSILFIDRENANGNVILMDASKLGTKVKVDGKNQRTVLSDNEITKIIDTFNAGELEDDFCVAVSYADIEAKKLSFSAGQYFEVKIEYVELTPEEFAEKMTGFTARLDEMFAESLRLESEIKTQLGRVKYE